MHILGIDPGLATIGLGLIEASNPHDMKVCEWLTIKTEAGLPLPARLLEIQKDLNEFLDETTPELAVVEKVYFSKNERTAMEVAQARGVIITALEERSIQVLDPTPSQLKSAICGDGKADKLQMQTMMMRILGLNEIPKPDDAADALALAVYGALVRSSLTRQTFAR